MYKIYINDLPLIICNFENAREYKNAKINTPFTFKKKFLNNYVDMLEKSDERDIELVLYSDDVEEAYNKFCEIFKIKEAAGGIIYNADRKILFIYRRGYWDLPKGKIDKGESKREAAIREVEEEVGLSKIEIQRELMTTYHTYRTKKSRILKPTYWYEMNLTDPTEPVTLQAEEDIEDHRWMTADEYLKDYSDQGYSSLENLIKQL